MKTDRVCGKPLTELLHDRDAWVRRLSHMTYVDGGIDYPYIRIYDGPDGWRPNSLFVLTIETHIRGIWTVYGETVFAKDDKAFIPPEDANLSLSNAGVLVDEEYESLWRRLSWSEGLASLDSALCQLSNSDRDPESYFSLRLAP